MNPATTLENHNPPATTQRCLKPSQICREESDTPHIQHGNTTTYITACDTHFHHNDPTVVHYECLIRYAFSPDTDNIPNHITVTHTNTTNSR